MDGTTGEVSMDMPDTEQSEAFRNLYESGQLNSYAGRLKRFSLINSLLQTFNRASASSPSGIIAEYFLRNFQHFNDLNIYDVARDCFTSRSGIRRFAQASGFSSFSEMKKNNWEWELWRHYFTDYVDHENFRQTLAARIDDMFSDIDEMVTDDLLCRLSELIHASPSPTLLASDFSAMAVREFQQSMIFMHKLVRVISDSEGDETVLRTLSDDDVVIVISASGNFGLAVSDDLECTQAHRVLITLNRDAKLADSYDTVCHLSRREYRRVRTVYSEYGVRYFFDLLYHAYFRLYGNEGEPPRT